MKDHYIRAFCGGLVLIFSTLAWGAEPEQAANKPNKAEEHGQVASAAAEVLHNEMSAASDNQIPEDLVSNARCTAVVPSRLKVGLIVGGSHGNGVVSCKTSQSEWSAPAFFELSSGSLGAQAGAKSSQWILLFMDQSSVDNLLEGNFKFGADVGVTAGTVGAQADISTKPAAIVAYRQNSQGLFAGAEIKGTRLQINQDANEEVYGEAVTTRDLLQGSAEVKASNEVKPFTQALDKFASPTQNKAAK